MTSDLHFGHNRDFIYAPRGFSSVEEHDEAIISNWNSTVNNDDIVYVLGDVMLGDNKHGLECISRLNGHINLIRGNHDTNARINLYKSIPNITYLGHSDMINYKHYHFYISHFPSITSNFGHEELKKATINLFGHTHSCEKFYNDNPYMYNVALDAHNCYPVSIEEIIMDCKEKYNEDK